MRIAITTESTCDLSKELLERFDIHTIPLMVTLGERSGYDGDITPQDIFEYAKDHKDLPKTNAVNDYRYEEFFKEILKDYDAIVHIGLSSALSSSVDCAKRVSTTMDNVYVIDSLNLSTGIGLQCIFAAVLAQKGKTPEEIVEGVEKRKPHSQASFYVETIDYLYKGGRCSAVAMIGAKILKIKPQIVVTFDGRMDVGSKYRGRKSKVAISYCEDVLTKNPNPDKSMIFVTHTYANPEIVNTVKEYLKEKGFKNIFETYAGATITSHCGQGTLGILFYNDGIETLD